jgi:hypothetical protein
MNASEAREPVKPKLLDAAGRTLLVIGVVVALVFVGAMLRATDGHFVPQVVDLYVTCQYAKALAEGHPFQYNPGEERSTGATSLLHMTLLGVAHGLGARGEALIAFAIALGAICYMLTILLARRLGAEVASERAGMLAGLLVALGGPAVWGFLYGADIALYMLATWLCERLAAEWERAIPRFAILACSLLVLTRPEGAVFAIVLSLLWWRRSAARASLPRRFVTLTPLATALGATLFQRALTGSWLGTSFADKSLLAK